jgi:hypothetical protein
VLLDQADWGVDYADEQSDRAGELRFIHEISGAAAALHWRGGDVSAWKRDRANSANLITTAPVLETIADVYQYIGGRPGRQEITALWQFEGRVLEFRAGVADIAAFRLLLGSLRRVDAAVWLSALPESVVKPMDRPHVVGTMLDGVPVPPGFDPSTIKGAALLKDRYQLGAAVAGAVACTWFKRWSDARRSGDAAGVREAIDAMATATDWPILQEMAESGDYPHVLEAFAAAMPSGLWYGRPLEGDVATGLGCPGLGIPLESERSRSRRD